MSYVYYCSQTTTPCQPYRKTKKRRGGECLPAHPGYGAGRGLVLREGMVLAIEPMVNLGTWEVKMLDDGWSVVTADGKPSAHWEHMVAITADGPRVLTLDP